MQGVRTLYSATSDDSKIETENGKIYDMPEINIMLIVCTMNLVINILSIIVIVDFCVKHEKLTSKIQGLERVINEQRKILRHRQRNEKRMK